MTYLFLLADLIFLKLNQPVKMYISRTLSDLYIQNRMRMPTCPQKENNIFYLNFEKKNIWLMFQNFIIPKLSNIGLVTIGSQWRLDDGMAMTMSLYA